MFKQKIILITGASSGLGQALAIALHAQGASLILTARNLEKLTETAALCQEGGSPPLLIPGDVTQEADCQRIMTAAMQHFGKLDYLILNAGISMWSRFDALSSMDVIKKLMMTNYLGAVQCTFGALDYLKQSQGMIVVISSVQGKIGVPFHTGYAASKHALHGFFDALRIELRPEKIDILTVCPGWIADTQLKHNAYYEHEHNVNKSKRTKSALPLASCVQAILKAMNKRQRELILPRHYQCISWLKLLCPGILDWIIARKL